MTEGGVDPAGFRPSSSSFGRTAGTVVTCTSCGHGSLAAPPAAATVATAYRAAADPVSLREEAGQVETARRALRLIEPLTTPGLACDLGCWTGSFLVAAAERGWSTVGVEPSSWAAGRARERGIEVLEGTVGTVGPPEHSCRLVAFGDVLEHLHDPGQALDVAHDLLEPGGFLWVTVPDAGSLLARLLGARWWSVLPMHLQYFTRATLRRLVESHGFSVRVVTTHAKVFSAGYYLERLAGYVPGLPDPATRLLRSSSWGKRAVAPDLRDRIAVIAQRS